MLGARGLRPRAGQHRHRRHQRTGARRRQARMGLEGPGQGRGLHRQGQRAGRRPLRAAYQIRSKQARTQACREAYCQRAGRAEGRRRRVRQGQGRRRCCSTSKRASCAARSWPASRASTAATRAPCARSRSATACCRAPTARRCSRAARRRRWWWPRWAPNATRSASTRWPASSPTASCCTTTCRRSPPAKPAAWARPKRREIGHGRLAKRALIAALPSKEDFPYTMRVVSRDHRVQRLVVDGLGVRRLPGADGRRRADEGPRGRHRHGPDQGRQPLRGADRHPG